jgi:hypothetical protein
MKKKRHSPKASSQTGESIVYLPPGDRVCIKLPTGEKSLHALKIPAGFYSITLLFCNAIDTHLAFIFGHPPHL